MNGLGACGGAGGAFAAGVAELVIAQFFKAGADVIEGTHVTGLFLAPDPLLLRTRILGDDLFEHLVVQRVELLDADDGGVLDLVLFAEFEEVVIHLAGAQNEARNTLRRDGEVLVVEHFLEGGAFGHVG